MNWDNVCVFLGVVVPLFWVVRWLWLSPLEKRYESALDELLAKEIARRLYHHATPVTLPYTPLYTPDDARRQQLLQKCLDAFTALTQTNASQPCDGIGLPVTKDHHQE